MIRQAIQQSADYKRGHPKDKRLPVNTDLGRVRAPCSTRAAWEIHWERMLLSS